MSFSQQVGGWVADATEATNDDLSAIVTELFASVISDTPILEGRLAANWQPSSQNPAEGTLDELDPSGAATQRKVVNFVTSFDFMDKDFKVYLTNNLPYAHRIEYDGYSKSKAPEGMVRINLIRISENIKRRL